MRAAVGNHLRIHGRHVADGEQLGEIIEVRGDDGRPPYVVRFGDGHESLIFPGPDCVVEDGSTTDT
ncbi:DUF1918 domain-containing protein [Tamaricihabitans halophyticus]|uniref:DUF1918 domain-containing protein n=1 Tax=Tamaricihabitans halophyticus TaxID=1262583 RepID=UPI00104B24F1|nr:DUF1918 domain-containing protein [Tamaricihabitans halophyticus]